MTTKDQFTIATTTSFSKIRGFTITLLFELKNQELRTMDLIDLTGKYAQYINRYLYNMRNYGLVKKDGSCWKLTPLGVSFLSYLKSVGIYYIYDKKELRKKKGRKKKEERKLERQKPLKQLSFSLWLQNSGCTLDDAEKVVVEVLLDHYDRTESKFFYFNNIYEIAEKFKMQPDQVNQVLMNLKQDHIAYSIKDRSHNAYKIGLYKGFIETLKAYKKVHWNT